MSKPRLKSSARRSNRADTVAHAIASPFPGRHLAGFALLLGICLGAAGVRLIGIDAQPLWLDEIITLQRASLHPSALIADSLANLHYPSYFLLVSAVLGVFGDSNFVLRMPSLLFGVLSVPVAYSIGRRIAGPMTGLAAATLLTLSPVHVLYSQEARSYALLCFLVLIALWGFTRLATNAPAAALPPSRVLRPTNATEADARAGWIAWAGGTAGALIVLNIAVFWLMASLAGMVAIRSWLAPGDRRHFDRTLLISIAFVAAIWLPWALAASPAFVRTAQHGFWAPPMSSSALSNAIWTVYLFGVAEPVGFERVGDSAPVRALAIALAAAVGAWSLRHNRALLTTLIAGAVLPPLLLLAASTVTPVFVPRYLIAGIPPFLLLAACGLVSVAAALSHAKPVAALLAALLIADLAGNLRTYHREEIKPRWDLAASLLHDSLQADDRVLFQSGFARWIVQTKLNRAGRALLDEAILGRPEDLDRNAFSGRVWVAYGRVGHYAGPDDSEIRRWLAEWGEPARIKQVGRQVRIAVFEFAPPAVHNLPPPRLRPRSRRTRSFQL